MLIPQSKSSASTISELRCNINGFDLFTEHFNHHTVPKPGEMVVGTQNGVTISHFKEEHSDGLDDDDQDMDDFDEDVPEHRRMTVTRVTDHAELAQSVLSAQSAPTINLSPMSPPNFAQKSLNRFESKQPIKMEQQVL